MKNVNATIIYNGAVKDAKTGKFVSLKTTIMETPMYIKEAKEKEVIETVSDSVETVEAPVKAPRAKKEKGDIIDIINILSATYGIEGTVANIEPTIIKVGRKVSNKLTGIDPAPKVKKSLTVEAEVNGTNVTKTFEEGEKIVF
jgi:hypothetical protein